MDPSENLQLDDLHLHIDAHFQRFEKNKIKFKYLMTVFIHLD